MKRRGDHRRQRRIDEICERFGDLKGLEYVLIVDGAGYESHFLDAIVLVYDKANRTAGRHRNPWAGADDRPLRDGARRRLAGAVESSLDELEALGADFVAAWRVASADEPRVDYSGGWTEEEAVAEPAEYLRASFAWKLDLAY